MDLVREGSPAVDDYFVPCSEDRAVVDAIADAQFDHTPDEGEPGRILVRVITFADEAGAAAWFDAVASAAPGCRWISSNEQRQEVVDVVGETSSVGNSDLVSVTFTGGNTGLYDSPTFYVRRGVTLAQIGANPVESGAAVAQLIAST